MGIPPDATQALLLSTASTLQELGESQKRLQAQMEAMAKGPATPASAANAPPPVAPPPTPDQTVARLAERLE
eukprot:14568556-Alexandrium_andersonii.AAC.1